MESLRIKEAPEEKLNEALAYAIMIIGFNLDNLDKAQMVILKDFLRSSFPMFKIDNFKEAFRLGAAGKLSVSLKHYNSFSAVYISDVLNAYSKHEQTQNLLPKPADNKALDYNKKEFSDYENKKAYDFIVGICKKENKIPRIANWVEAYFYMEKTKLIDMDNDAKEMFMENVIYDIKAEIRQRKHDNIDSRNLKNTLDFKGLLKAECRKQMVIQHFKNLGYESHN